MNTNDSNTIKSVAALSTLLNNVDAVDSLANAMHGAVEKRAASLEALRSLGFTSLQSGKAARYDKPLTAGEFSYKQAVAEFTARFLAKKPNATKAQIDNNNKQQSSALNVWLVTGKFTTNTGRDMPRIEVEVASELSTKLDFEAKHSAIKAKQGKAEVIEAVKAVAIATKAAVSDNKAIDIAKKSGDTKAINTATLAAASTKADLVAAQALASHAKKAAELLEVNRKKAADAATKAKADLIVKTEKVEAKKVQASDSKIASGAGCSKECQLEALELFAMLEEDNTSLATMLELSRLISAKYR